MGDEEPFPWGDLPIELQITVLGWLPLRSLFRVKSVCKLWNSIFSSSSSSFTHFPSLLPCGPSPCPSPWLILVNPETFKPSLAFDFTTRSWFSLDMRFLSRMLQHCPHFYSCAGSSCGRLLLKLDSVLHICNPLTRSVDKLPPLNSIEVTVTHCFSTTYTGGRDHTVIVIAEAKAGLVFEEFRSLPSSFVMRLNQMIE